MAILDPKNRLIDIVLTENGRKKLSAGQLKVVYYRFFDDEVDYQVPTEDAPVAEVSPDPPVDGAVVFGSSEDIVIFGTAEDIVIFGT